MKKNMLSVLILALLIVNVALTSIMMFTMMGTNKKTAKLIDGISTALSLEITDPSMEGVEAEAEVAMEDIKVHQIPDQLTIGLAKGADGKSHYCVVSISLSLNTKDPDYEKYSATLADNEDMIKDKIFQVVGSHTIEEAESNTDGLREEILEAIQQMYGSKFVYNIVFRDIMFS
ncbi:MAG: flagellar basal body-associated FliL family protein [Lachnospiraceae bacterium]|nr:flagellar basal body-associated FliL family protein [Lachnospiraceae bacterium]MBP5745634.1 flagellar basal body-associated FliL family protein [Lachnospiraceae bacterium]